MDVRFRRTAQRQYTVTVLRDDLAPHEFAGPGYDAKLPHDLQHFIVERELGLDCGVFGFFAAGGDAGGDSHETGRAASRRRRKAKQRDQRLLRTGARAQGDTSEHATFTCWFEWLRRSGDPHAATLAKNIGSTVAELAVNARRWYGDETLVRVCSAMDELSAKWSSLAVGDSFTVPWRGKSRRTIRSGHTSDAAASRRATGS